MLVVSVCVLLLLAAAGRVAAQEGGDDSLARVQRAGVLRWGGDVQGGAPYAFEAPGEPGRLLGFEVDIAERLAERLRVKAQFVQNDWSTLTAALERGAFDIVLNGLEVTPARRARLRLSRPYFVFAERLTVRADAVNAPEASAAGVRGRRVGTLASSLAWDLLGQWGAERRPYEGVAEPFMDLQQGRLDAVLMDDIIADRYGRRAGLRVAGDVAPGHYAVGLRTADATLGRAVDAALGAMLASGELRAVLARWGLDGPRQAALLQAPEPDRASEPRLRAIHAADLWLFVTAAAATLRLSLVAMVLAVVVGLGLALLRARTVRGRVGAVLGWLAGVYVEVFRGTPVLLQLYVIYFAAAPVLALNPFSAAVIGLGLNYGAYESEIYRAGIGAVPRGQIEAARALGLRERLVWRRVILPQALRVSLPGVANDFIALLKDSALVSVISVVELTKRMTIAAVDWGDWLRPGLLCAAFYFAMSYPLAVLARRVEAVLARGH